MKTLRKFKLLTIVTLAGLMMTSCLKHSEPEFQIGVLQAYILQNGTGENASFVPNIRIYAYESIKRATAKWNDETFYFSPVENTQQTIMDLSLGYGVGAFDTIPNGTYAISAVNAEGKLASGTITFEIKKALGELNVSELTYKPETGISAKWELVPDATNYYLAVRLTSGGNWIMSEWREGASSNLTAGTYNSSIDFAPGTKYQFAVAAFNKGLVILSKPIHVTWGENQPE